MTRTETLQRLQVVRSKASRALRLLESKPLPEAARLEIQSLAKWLKEELQSEYNRMLPERVQRSMTMFELSVYSPAVEEAWKESGIRRLKVDGVPDQRWQEPLEAVAYMAGKYLLESTDHR